MKKSVFKLSHIISGFVAVLVGFTSSVLIVFQAAHLTGANAAEMSSWLFGLGLSISLTSIGFSWYYRMPILTGWSTPGAALLATSLTGISLPQALGSFVFAALLTALVGGLGLFERVMRWIPKTITSAMLAGILLRFGLDVFQAFQQDMQMVGLMLFTYVIGRRFFSRYVIVWVLLVGLLDASLRGMIFSHEFQWEMSTPMFVMPEFQLKTLISIGIPLFIVTMTSQNMPGLSVITGAGYQPPVSKLVVVIGLVNALFAPFGCYSISLAAMTAALCTGKESDLNPKHRYKSSIIAGIFWMMIGVLGTTVVVLFTSFPKALVLTIAGLALFNTIGSSLYGAIHLEKDREPAVLTLLVTASGFTIWGIGSAFWGLLMGMVAMKIMNSKPLAISKEPDLVEES